MRGATYGAASLWLLPRLRVIRRLARANAWLFTLIALALISALWSQLPEVSARRAAALSLNFFFTLFLVLRFSPEKLLRLVLIALTASAVASLAVVAVAPDIGIHQGDSHVGAWRGVFGHKNSAGRMMSLAVVIGLLLVADAKRRRILYCAGLLPTLLMLAMSGSATGWVATVAALISVPPLLAARGMPITPTIAVRGRPLHIRPARLPLFSPI
jgi:exopolysaccharide production protein ExoQ